MRIRLILTIVLFSFTPVTIMQATLKESLNQLKGSLDYLANSLGEKSSEQPETSAGPEFTIEIKAKNKKGEEKEITMRASLPANLQTIEKIKNLLAQINPLPAGDHWIEIDFPSEGVAGFELSLDLDSIDTILRKNGIENYSIEKVEAAGRYTVTGLSIKIIGLRGFDTFALEGVKKYLSPTQGASISTLEKQLWPRPVK